MCYKSIILLSAALITNVFSVAETDISDETVYKTVCQSAEMGDKDSQYRLGIFLHEDSALQKRDDKIAYKWLLKAARQKHEGALTFLKTEAESNVWAQYNLALYYEKTEAALSAECLMQAAIKNHHESLGLLADKAQEGDMYAEYYYGVFHEQKGDKEKTLVWYLRAAEHGYAPVQYQLGKMHADKKERLKAMEWYQKAANDSPEAAYALGKIYEKGKVVPKDDVQAFWLYRKAAEKGHLAATFEAGKRYLAQNKPKKAFRHYQKVAEQGDKEAQYHLGMMYLQGKVEGAVNLPKAQEWLEKSAAQNYLHALYQLGEMYHKGPLVVEVAKAFGYHLKAAELGAARSQYLVGFWYGNGNGGQKDDAKSLEWLLKSIAQGHVPACQHLAQKYEQGQGVPKNSAIAFQYRKIAAERNNRQEQFLVAQYYEGVLKDEKEALKWYRKASNSSGSASLAIGRFYEEGLGGLAKDPAKAFEAYQKAASQGVMNAQYRVAKCYETGDKKINVIQNDLEAVRFYTLAATQGHKEAQVVMGLRYRTGQGIGQDFAQSFKYYSTAANQGEVDAQRAVGEMYADGIGTAKNEAEAIKWYKKAIASGDQKSLYPLAVLLEQTEGLDKAVETYRKAAEAGDLPACRKMGVFYLKGIGGVEKDMSKAVEWLEKVDDVESLKTLGWCYFFGKGVAKDLGKAFGKFVKTPNDSFGQRKLGSLYYEGAGVPKDRQKARELLGQAAGKGNPLAAIALTMLAEPEGIDGKQEPMLKLIEEKAKAGDKLANIEQAADNDDRESEYYLGCMYLFGWGREKSVENGLEYLEYAAEKGHAMARCRAGEVYHALGRHKEAIEMFSRAAGVSSDSLGRRRALTNLGVIYENGFGVEQSAEKAIEYFEKLPGALDPVLKELYS